MDLIEEISFQLVLEDRCKIQTIRDRGWGWGIEQQGLFWKCSILQTDRSSVIMQRNGEDTRGASGQIGHYQILEDLRIAGHVCFFLYQQCVEKF